MPNTGRPPAIPARLIPELLQHRQQGLSWGELARWLRNTCAVDCSRWAVRSMRPQIGHLFGAVTTKLQQIREKPLHSCKDFSSLIYVWSGGRDSNSRHSAWKAEALPLSYHRISQFKSSSNSPAVYHFSQYGRWKEDCREQTIFRP